MPRKQRDYKAEYQRSKERARAEGYRSPYERKVQRRKLRESLGSLVNRDSTALAWSTLHSRRDVSAYDPDDDWSEARKSDYYNTYVAIPNRGRKAKNIYKYLRRWEPDYADEHRSNYV